MTSDELERNKHSVQSFLDLLGAGDIEAAFASLTEDATWFSLSTRTHVHRDEMKDAIARTFSSLLQAPIQQQVTTMTAEDQRVAVMSEGHAVTVDGVRYDNLYHFLFELREGMITRIWEFNDTAHVRDVLRRGEGGALGFGSGPAPKPA
jgi:uncharacterized protein